MKTVIIVLIVLGIISFLGVLILAFIAGVHATSSAIDQAYDDMEQEKAIRKWLAEKNRTDCPSTMHKGQGNGGDS